MEKTIKDMMQKVDEFQKKVIKVPYTGSIPRSRHEHLKEEVQEICAAHDIGDIPGVADGLVDLIYVALGTLLQLGVHPNHAFDLVHEANMKKRGEKTARHDYDAVKPEGWEPPDFGPMLERLEILNQISPVFIDLTKMRLKKGNNYNRGNVKRMDHFPMGDLSFFQVIWMKMCRVRSLTENPGATDEEKRESRRLVEREMNDIVVYGGFWLEFIRGLDI